MPEQNRDLVLPLGTYAHILDKSKGNISVTVGPYRATVSETDVPVKWNGKTHDRLANIDLSIQPFITAEEGDYVVLQNPSADGNPSKEGTSTVATTLAVGRKVSIPGPVSFPLWPGQSAEVIEGHLLRTNQYLVVRVYNDAQAKASWGKAIMKRQTGGEATVAEQPPPSLVTGQLLVIKGTDVAFYIPPTGVEVVRDENGSYVREAVTLERLEYSILLDENGNKRYLPGPMVVFPNPTETFMIQNSERKFRALELSEISGIHIKVIADYTEGENDKKKEYKVGDELFITGKETSIYYPRPEHAIIKYDGRELHHAIAIPEGDARYVLQRIGPNSGTVRIVRGLTMFLPDPRYEVIVKRVLTQKEVEYLYPGNTVALQHNQVLAQQIEASGTDFLMAANAPTAYMSMGAGPASARMARVAIDSIDRKNTYTPPRSITLNNKYDGVVNIQLWTGYALLIVSSTGKRRVVVGPTHIQLEYDEFPQVFQLSTGKPKTTDKLYTTVYLKVKNNQVSDIIDVTTRDMVEVKLKVSYRVDFRGENPEDWFAVDNYVKFLCDHVRSMMKNKAKEVGIADFHNNAINIIRDTVLGKSDGSKRPGLVFEENKMVAYDVEVLDVAIANPRIADMLEDAQHKAVADAIDMGNRERGLEVIKKQEKIAQETARAKDTTDLEVHQLKLGTLARKAKEDTQAIVYQFDLQMQRVSNQIKETETKLEADKKAQVGLDEVAKAELNRKIAASEADLKELKAKVDIEVNAIVERMKAMSSEMVTALTTFGQQDLAKEILQALAPVALAQNTSGVEYAQKLFQGTPFGSVFDTLAQKGIPATTPKK